MSGAKRTASVAEKSRGKEETTRNVRARVESEVPDDDDDDDVIRPTVHVFVNVGHHNNGKDERPYNTSTPRNILTAKAESVWASPLGDNTERLSTHWNNGRNIVYLYFNHYEHPDHAYSKIVGIARMTSGLSSQHEPSVPWEPAVNGGKFGHGCTISWVTDPLPASTWKVITARATKERKYLDMDEMDTEHAVYLLRNAIETNSEVPDRKSVRHVEFLCAQAYVRTALKASVL